MPGPTPATLNDWDAALVTLNLEGPDTVMAQFPIWQRWNGWLNPELDAGALVQVLEFLSKEEPDYGFLYDFDADGTLILTEVQWRDEAAAKGEPYEPQRIPPTVDGLYPMGWGWVWSYADQTLDPAKQPA